MGVPSITAGRILKGQMSGSPAGEEAVLTMDRFAHAGLSKVRLMHLNANHHFCKCTT